MEISSKSRQKMPKLVKKQAAGNLTIADFCRRHQIRPNTFFYWKKKLRENGKSDSGDSHNLTRSSGFVPITLSSTQDNSLPDKIELYFPTGIRASIPVSAGSNAIHTIIRACGKR